MPRARTPTKVKELSGNPGKRSYKADVKPTRDLVQPPTLTPTAKAVWKRLVSAMPRGVYQITDQALLAAYCEQVAIHEQCVTALTNAALNPMIVPGSQGQLVVSPFVKIMNEAARLMVTLGARLHLDPVSRQSINAPESNDDDDFAPAPLRH